MPESFGSRDPGSVVQPCPLKNRPVHWIEIELVGEDDLPIPWEEYEVRLPNGDVARGYLDDDGWARIDHIDPPGECQVCFPALDREAWERHQTSPLGPKETRKDA